MNPPPQHRIRTIGFLPALAVFVENEIAYDAGGFN